MMDVFSSQKVSPFAVTAGDNRPPDTLLCNTCISQPRGCAPAARAVLSAADTLCPMKVKRLQNQVFSSARPL